MVCNIFFRSEFPDIPKNLDDIRKQIARQLQSVMLHKQTQQEDLDICVLNLQIT